MLELLMDTFTYRAIDLSKDAVRMVRLCRGSYADPIRCELFEAHLDQTDEYHQFQGVPFEALSYTWGDQSSKVDIWLDGQKASVTGNLFAALVCLRLGDKDRILWVDAICIDQENDKEKGHQVSRMKRIYESAEGVLIWLGPGSDDTDLLMESALELDRRARRSREWEAEWVKMEERRALFETDFGSRRRAGLHDLLQRPWFRRVWIIQECASARRATVHCGWKSVSTRTFPLLPRLMGEEIDSHIQAVLDVMPSPSRSKSWWTTKRSLIHLLRRFGGSEASDSRDIIYALLGISSDVGHQTVISPDYEISFQESVKNAIWAILFNEAFDRDMYKLPDWSKAEFLASLHVLPLSIYEWAISTGETPVLLRLLFKSHGDGVKANFDHGIFRDRLPLHELTESPAPSSAIEALLAVMDFDVNLQAVHSGDTLLHLAVERDRLAVVETLLQRKDLEINLKNKNGDTPLLIAACTGNVSILKLLLRHEEVDVNYRRGDIMEGDTALSIAEAESHLDAMELLLQHEDIHINCEDRFTGNSLLHFAVEKPSLSEVRLLLQHPEIKLHHKNRRGATPLEVAADMGLEKIVGQILSACSDMDTKLPDLLGSALVQAAGRGHLSIVKLLVSRGAHMDVANFVLAKDAWNWYNDPWSLRSRMTPLCAAVENQREAVTELLLQHNARVDIRGDNGLTPLEFAVKANNKTLIRILEPYAYRGNDTNMALPH